MPSHITGLTQEEALKFLKEFGPNEIKDLHKVSPLRILLRQTCQNAVIYLLLAAAAISFFIGKPVTAYTVLGVVFIVIFVSFIQEFKAEKAIAALKQMIMPVSLVTRDGKEQEVPSKDLVPGDVVTLRTGEKVPADLILLEAKDLSVNESLLTGEANEIHKTIPNNPDHYGEENLLFMGSFVVGGRGQARVLHTGMNTKFGSIAGMISTAEKELPLQDKINRIAKYMVIAALTISFLTGFFMMTRSAPLSSEAFTNILVLVIALSVSAFPEGLPVVLVTTLAVGASRMAKRNAIVNRMSIIETLGETTVICADKTGTITRGEMTVKKIYTNGQTIDVSGSGYEAKGEFLVGGRDPEIEKNIPLQMLFKAAVFCNDSRIERTGEDEYYKTFGTPTESSLLIMAAKADVFREDLSCARKEEIPFSSERKMMSVLCSDGKGSYVYVKGALEIILDRCEFIQDGEGIVELTDKKKEEILKVNKEWTKGSYRTLAMAYRKTSVTKDYTEDGLVFLGFVGIDDPPREEVKEAIETCQRAGIAIKMITGDHKETALSVASEIGLAGKVLEGEELDQMTDEELEKVIKDITVFARVRPEHKLRLVKLLKKLGEIVTMTGDGVNDSPALKEAHIGVAMGKNGTDVSRSVADLTLKDDNFATIVTAIREGRTIFANIRKFVSYQLSCNYAELSILFLGVLLAPSLGWQIPLLLALQILFMNLVTDDLPALTLAFNPTSQDVMHERPRKKANILNKQTFLFTISAASLMAFLTLTTFYISFNVLGQGLEVARTTALVALILLEIVGAFHFRSFRKQVLTRSPFVNPYLFYASVISVFATLLIIYTPLNQIFETVPIGWFGWVISFAAAVIYIIVFDLIKGRNGTPTASHLQQ